MFDFTLPVALAGSVAFNVIFGIVLLVNHAQQKAHHGDLQDMEEEIVHLKVCLEDQRECAREMYLKLYDENDRLIVQGDALEDILNEVLDDNNVLEVSLGQAMSYATDLEAVIETALDTIMEQRETIDVLRDVVYGVEPEDTYYIVEDEQEPVDFFVNSEGHVTHSTYHIAF